MSCAGLGVNYNNSSKLKNGHDFCYDIEKVAVYF